MRRFGLTLTTLALLTVPGCNNAPTSPDEDVSFDKAYAGHSAGRIVVGGQIREGPWKISFGGHTDIGTGGEVRGNFRANFHSVSVPAISGRKFVATEIVGLGFAPSDNPAACIARSNWVMVGTLDGEPGFRARVLAADAGRIGGGAFDDFRLVIYTDEETPIPLYDTSDFNPARPGGDFPSVSDCNGPSRALLDSGSVKIWLAD